MVTEASAENIAEAFVIRKEDNFMLDCCKKNKWFYFGLTIPSMLLYVLALAGPLLLGHFRHLL